MRLALALVLLATAAHAQPSGRWEGTLLPTPASAHGRCTQMVVKIAVAPDGAGSITLQSSGPDQFSETFRLSADGAFSATIRAFQHVSTVSGTLSASGGTVDYRNPSGCAYSGPARRL